MATNTEPQWWLDLMARGGQVDAPARLEAPDPRGGGASYYLDAEEAAWVNLAREALRDVPLDTLRAAAGAGPDPTLRGLCWAVLAGGDDAKGALRDYLAEAVGADPPKPHVCRTCGAGCLGCALAAAGRTLAAAGRTLAAGTGEFYERLVLEVGRNPELAAALLDPAAEIPDDPE